MRYENSLTTNVQDFIANTLARKISAAQESWEISHAAKDVRIHLSDPASVNTPDFVIRRFIQKNYPELLPQGIDIPSLLENNNIVWSSKIIGPLAGVLFSRSKECGAKITKKEWERYLSGSSSRSRQKVYQIAFTLNMDVSSTIDLFLAFDMEPYSVRYPLDLICLFCQNIPGKYSWYDAISMLNEFTNNLSAESIKNADPTAGMTQQIFGDLDAIFAKSLPDTDAKAALVQYMLNNASEFVTMEVSGKREYIPGYSLGRLNKYMRLTEYLLILYPSYFIIEERLPGENTQDAELKDWGPGAVITTTSQDPASIENPLSFLARSMFYNSEWKEIEWDIARERKDSKTVFEDCMRILCANFEQHMMAVDRMRKGKKHAAFFERRDALLFIYFLFNGYMKLCETSGPEAQEAYDQIDDMLNSGDDFDYTIAEALDEVNFVFQNIEDVENLAERFRCLTESVNLILTELGYPNLYMPARFDRFITLALLSESPDTLTPLIMCENELLFFEKDNNCP